MNLIILQIVICSQVGLENLGLGSSEDDLCPELLRAVEGVKYIADVTRREEESNKVETRPLSETFE